MVTAAPVSTEAAPATLIEVRLWDIVVHTFPRRRIAASSSSRCTTAAATASHTISTSALSVASAAAATASTSTKLLLLLVVVESLLLITTTLACTGLVHLALHLLLHLLHHSGIHAGHGVLASLTSGIRAAAAALSHLVCHLHLHHLLHHGWIHTARHHAHAHAPVHGHLLLHHGHVLLHPLHVLRHYLRRHATLRHLIRHRVLRAGLLLWALSELATPRGLFFLTHVATGLSLLDLNGLAVNLQGNAEAVVHASLALERDEAEAPGSSSVLVHHQGGIDDATELGEVVLEFGFCRVLADTADKDLAGLFLFVARNCPLGINLSSILACFSGVRSEVAYNLPIQEVLLDHNNVHCLGVLEGEEAETSRSAGRAISHDSAFRHLTKLGEIITKGLWKDV